MKKLFVIVLVFAVILTLGTSVNAFEFRDGSYTATCTVKYPDPTTYTTGTFTFKEEMYIYLAYQEGDYVEFEIWNDWYYGYAWGTSKLLFYEIWDQNFDIALAFGYGTAKDKSLKLSKAFFPWWYGFGKCVMKKNY